MPIDIQGGSSGYQTVSFMTKNYVSTAKYTRGEIYTHFQPRVLSKIHRYDRYMPLLLRLVLSLIVLSTWPMRVLILSASLLPYLDVDPASSETRLGSYFVGLVLLLHLRYRIAPWHGAEHMVFGTYKNSGQTSMGAIRAGSRVDPNCGGRLAVPFLLVFLIAYVAQAVTNLSSLWFFFPLMEGLLWFDHLKGLVTVPFFVKASELIQRHFTTKTPTVIELETGREALLLLIQAEAHHKP